APAGSRAPARGAGEAAPAGEVLVEYALIGDTLLAWTLSGGGRELHRARIDAAGLARTVGRALALLEDRDREREARPALAELHALLVAPLRRRLGAAGTPLVIVADGELAAVPFAALHDGRGGRYLVEDHPLRFAVSLSEARRGAGRPPRRDDAVVVADPAFDEREHAELERLPGAADEARAIAGEYPRAALVAGAAATRAAVEGALGRAGVVHYAGHAVFDDERPERSYLVLAPAPGRLGSGRLTAAELAELELAHAPLVVLAACRTLRSGGGRAGGFSGLAGALLAAGARGTVGSLWEVDDRLTRALMVEFHRAYRASGSGPEALRAAQLRLLHSTDPALRSPAAWAGFRYAGR
ncbi:MAG TPA: CHAT domain-containing protein, partial [Longimicrobium sp.]|nr:CHAT domain-containing protein [Longimicrobium sp.]